MNPRNQRGSVLSLAGGLACVAAYWLAVAPPDPSWLGYAEDIGNQELARVLMAENLREHGWPAFTTARVLAPGGGSIPYYSWLMERDWIGGYLWNWSPSFPWAWVYLGLSLVASFLLTGWMLGRMALPLALAWSLATLFVLFNLPRHYKLYYHYEHVIHHWLYASIFLDALIAHRFWRTRRWSLHLELWRGVCLVGMLGTAGYYWGPLIFEWAAFRAVLGAALVKRLLAGPRTQIELARRPARMAAAAGLFLCLLDLRWFLPLLAEMRRFGEVQQIRGYYGSIGMILRPLWLEPALRTLEFSLPGSIGAFSSRLAEWRLLPLDWPETIVTVGWIYLVPAALGLWLIRQGRGGPGRAPLLAFLVTWIFGALYAREGWPSSYHDAVARAVPFMNYFRVASRMGLIFVPLLGAMIALAWPELSRWARERWSGSRTFRVVAGTFAALSAAEVSTLATPIVTMPPLMPEASALLDRLRGEPGSTVLDMPFCVAGGNGVCTPEFCARYPGQTMPMYLTARHGKKVFGVYQGRLNEQHCAKYREPPYRQWAEAWRGDRCLMPAEWDGLCAYLADSHEISAILVFPGIWTAAGQPECAAEFRRRLGAPRARAEIATNFRRGPIPDSDRAESIGSYWPTPVLWYGPRCSEPDRTGQPPSN